MSQKTLLITLGIGVLALVGFVAFNAYMYQAKQSDNLDFEPYRATLEGEYLCLTNAEASSEEGAAACEYGIRTDTGEYYAINFYLMSQIIEPVMVGERIKASGVITPIERLSTDQWYKYGVEGIFSVTDSVEILQY